MPNPTLEAPTETLRRLVDDTLRAWDPIWQAWATAVPTWPAATPETTPSPGHEHEHHGCSEHRHGSAEHHGCSEHRHGSAEHHGCSEHRHGCTEPHGCTEHPHGSAEHEHHGPAEHRPASHCSCDRCACRVCDADLVVVTRLGESRIVPLVIHNDIRRARTVTVKVGEFSGGCHGDADIRVAAAVRPAGEITLQPCSRTEVAILLRSSPAAKAVAEVEKGTEVEKGAEVAKGIEAERIAAERAVKATARTRKATMVAETPNATMVAETPRAAPEMERLERGEPKDLPDVDCCTTLYADVSVAGCGRPVRLAVVVLPRGCDAYDIRCGCGCCC